MTKIRIHQLLSRLYIATKGVEDDSKRIEKTYQFEFE